MFPHFLIFSINISNKQLFSQISSQFLYFSSIIMEEAKVIQDKIDQINSLRQEKQPPLPFFPIEKQTHVSNPESDLNLRLSLGDIYNPEQNPLTRSSSIAVEVVNSKRIFIEHSENTFPKSYLSVARASSLPLEMGSAKRVVNMKELRVMRRAEARKRAEEKHRNAMKGTDVPCFPTEIPAWAVDSAAKSPALDRAIGKIKESLKTPQGLEGSENLNPKREIASEAETENLNPRREIASEAETKNPNPAKKAKVSTNGCSQDEGMAVMERMPSVTITGDGPNGRRIEGFLYQYNKREVTIVCVCHGHFLSPEEFVKHAGCKDVTNPLKQISVFRSPFY